MKVLILACAVFALTAGQSLVPDVCLDCICGAATGCARNFCEGETCGPFALTWAYWADGGKLLSTSDGRVFPDWAACANDNLCARQTVQNYLLKFKQDCNGDGIIDCRDFLSIHFNGAYGCAGGLVKEPHMTRYNQCVATKVVA